MHKIFKIGNLLEGVIAAGIGADAIATAANGNYKIAALEAITSVWLGASVYLKIKQTGSVRKFVYETAPALVESANQINIKQNEKFKELFKTLETYSR